MNVALRRLLNELAWLTEAERRVRRDSDVPPDLATVYLEQIWREMTEIAVAIDRLETEETAP